MEKIKSSAWYDSATAGFWFAAGVAAFGLIVRGISSMSSGNDDDDDRDDDEGDE